MRAASEQLVPVTLELGGKSPVLVDRGSRLRASRPTSPTANWRTPARRASRRTTCCCRGRRRCVRRGLGQGRSGAIPGGAGERGLHVDREHAHYERLRGLLDDARAKGARVVETGPSPEHMRAATTRSRQRWSSTSMTTCGSCRRRSARVADRDVSRPGRRDRFCERPAASARALLLRILRNESEGGSSRGRRPAA